MTGMLMVRTHAEEDLMLRLIQEFGSKVILPRNFQATDTFKKYAKEGVYGVIGIDHDKTAGEAIYEVALPKVYIQYIEYEIGKLRTFVEAAKEKKTSIQK